MRTDALIKKDIVDELIRDARVDASRVDVSVVNGVVTLRGEAPTMLGKISARDDALSILGVTEVINDLTVRYPETASIPTDTEIKDNIIMKLAENPDINVLDLNVSVNAGMATLRGTVDAYWKKIYAEILISPEPGITLVENHIAVTPADDVVDQAIAKDIVSSLEARAAVDAEEVDVSVIDGNVTLTGAVPDWISRRSAADAAFYAAGVKTVTNNLTVAGA